MRESEFPEQLDKHITADHDPVIHNSCPVTGLECDDFCTMCDTNHHSSVIKECENCAGYRLCPTCAYTDPELTDMVFCDPECIREFKETE